MHRARHARSEPASRAHEPPPARDVHLNPDITSQPESQQCNGDESQHPEGNTDQRSTVPQGAGERCDG